MDTGNKNKNKKTPDINEEMMMNLMVDGVRKEGLQLPPEPEVIREPAQTEEPLQEKPAVKPRSRNKKISEADYEGIFFKKTDTHARDGKTVYIRPEFHEKLSRIIHVIGRDKISIYNY